MPYTIKYIFNFGKNLVEMPNILIDIVEPIFNTDKQQLDLINLSKNDIWCLYSFLMILMYNPDCKCNQECVKYTNYIEEKYNFEYIF